MHHGRGIKAEHFARFVEHMLSTLADLGVTEEEANLVIGRINSLANEITGVSY